MSDIDLTLANGWVLSLLVPICIYLAFQVYRTRHLAVGGAHRGIVVGDCVVDGAHFGGSFSNHA
jgi:hypothetical protein